MRRQPARAFALCAALGSVFAAAPLAAHPHEFVDVVIGFGFDPEGRIASIEVEWRYDTFTSMLILGDLGLDPSVSRLAPSEAPELQGFDLAWVADYNGDLWPVTSAGPLALAGPEGGETRVEEGRVMSRHSRALLEPLDPAAAPLSLRAYDPEFYLAYTILPVAEPLARADCTARLVSADMDRAFAILAELLAQQPETASEEDDFPPVGREFSDEIQLSCQD